MSKSCLNFTLFIIIHSFRLIIVKIVGIDCFIFYSLSHLHYNIYNLYTDRNWSSLEYIYNSPWHDLLDDIDMSIRCQSRRLWKACESYGLPKQTSIHTINHSISQDSLFYSSCQSTMHHMHNRNALMFQPNNPISLDHVFLAFGLMDYKKKTITLDSPESKTHVSLGAH